MDLSTATTVLEFHGLEYQWAFYTTRVPHYTGLESKKLEYQVEFLNTQMPCQKCHGVAENRELEFSELEY